MKYAPKAGQPVQNFAFGGIANPVQRAVLRASDRSYLDARQAELDAFEKQRQEYNTALQQWQTGVYQPYQQQVQGYNTAAQQYNTDVYQPYQQQVNAYNAALEAYNRDVYDPYVKQYGEYEQAINAWNQGPRTTDYAGPAAPTLASTFDMAAPVAPSAFSMSAPGAPTEFSMVAPTLPFDEAAVAERQRVAASRAQEDAQARGLAIEAVANPDKYNFGSKSVSARFMAEGGPVDKSASQMMQELAGQVASAGRGGDEMLAYLSPSSAQLLKEMGGAGTVNPATGLPEYRFNIEALRARQAQQAAAAQAQQVAAAQVAAPPVTDSQLARDTKNAAKESSVSIVRPAVPTAAEQLAALPAAPAAPVDTRSADERQQDFIDSMTVKPAMEATSVAPPPPPTPIPSTGVGIDRTSAPVAPPSNPLDINAGIAAAGAALSAMSPAEINAVTSSLDRAQRGAPAVNPAPAPVGPNAFTPDPVTGITPAQQAAADVIQQREQEQIALQEQRQADRVAQQAAYDQAVSSIPVAAPAGPSLAIPVTPPPAPAPTAAEQLAQLPSAPVPAPEPVAAQPAPLPTAPEPTYVPPSVSFPEVAPAPGSAARDLAGLIQAPAPTPAPAPEPVYVPPPVLEPVYVAPPVSEPVYVAPPVSEPVYVAPPISEPVYVAPPVSEPVYVLPPVVEEVPQENNTARDQLQQLIEQAPVQPPPQTILDTILAAERAAGPSYSAIQAVGGPVSTVQAASPVIPSQVAASSGIPQMTLRNPPQTPARSGASATASLPSARPSSFGSTASIPFTSYAPITSGQPLFTGNEIRIVNPEIPMIGGYSPVTTGRQQEQARNAGNYFALTPRTSASLPGAVGMTYDPTAAYRGQTAVDLLRANPNLSPMMLGGMDSAGIMTDRLGNQIYSPGFGLVRAFSEGGEVEDEDELPRADNAGTAQDMLGKLDSIGPKRVRRQSMEGGASGSKEMTMSQGSLTTAKDLAPKAPKSAKVELEQLARKYKIKQRQIANASKGFGKSTFGAPTLEQPTLTGDEFGVKRFQKGGEAKKSEASEDMSVMSRIVDAIAQRTPADMLPTPGRLLVETAQGKRDDITEKDFTPEELEVIRASIIARGASRGSAGYREYDMVRDRRRAEGKEGLNPLPLFDPVYRVEKSLGRFRYGRDDQGNLVAMDTYDFNPSVPPGMPQQTQESRTGDYGVLGPYGVLREYAGERFPPGKGRNVRINLGGGRPPGYAEGGEVEQDLSGPITTPLQFNKRQKRGRISEALNDPSASAYANMAKGASELPYDILGAPVDIATMLMRPAGYSVEKPVGGSEFIKEKMTKAGVRPEPPSDSVDKGFYTAGELLANLTNPAGVTRSATRGAGKAADMLEDVTVGNVQRAKVRGAAKKAEATPESAYDPLRQRMEEQGLLSYAVRPTGSTMISGDIAGQSGQGIVDGILAQGKSNARNAAGADDAMASALENFWEKKAKNYFTRQFGTPNDPIADALSKGRISNFETQELFPQYMVDQIGVGKTRVNPRTGEPQFFPKYPRAMEDFTSRYDEATGLTGLAYAPGMGDPGYSTILRNEAQALRRELNDAEMDRLVQQGVRPELVNTNIDVVTESGKDPGRFIAQSYIPNSFDQLLAAYKGNASMPQSLRIPLERQEPLYDTRGLKAPLENLLDPPRINEYLAGLSPREVSKIRFEDAVVGASKVENPRYRLKALQDKIKSGKPVPDSVFSKGVSAPLLQIKEGPLEGFAWKRIVDREATVPEGAYVGHSVGGYELGGVTYGPEKMNGFNTGLYEIYSLRDKRNRPVNTIEVKNDPLFGKTVTQIKGNGRATGNVSPDKYDTAVLDFLTNYLRPARISESTDLLTPLLQEYKMRVNSGS